MANSGQATHVFIVRTGFQYYFSTLLIQHLQLEPVVYIMWRPRERIEQLAAKQYPVICSHGDSWLIKRLGGAGRQLAKWRFAQQAAKTLRLSKQSVYLYTSIYSNSLIPYLSYQLNRRANTLQYCMFPDGAALLRPMAIRRPRTWLIKRLSQWLQLPLADDRHECGSYSEFLNKIYHFPAKKIFADPAKLEIIPVKHTHTKHNGQILILGGCQGISQAFVVAAKGLAEGFLVKYRLHPDNHAGEHFIASIAPEWEPLNITTTFEEHVLANTYYKVIGYYSSAIIFNHLFVDGSQSEFLLDKPHEDADYHAIANACDIPVTLM